MPNSRLTALRNAFLTGLLLLAPLVVTVWAFLKIIDIVGGNFRPLFDTLIPHRLQDIPLVWEMAVTVIVFALVTLFGLISHYFFGKYLLDLGERAILAIPGLNTVYRSVKQLVSTFGSQNRNLFNRVVLVQYPRPGVWTLGFLTSKTQADPRRLRTLGSLYSHLPDSDGWLYAIFSPSRNHRTSNVRRRWHENGDLRRGDDSYLAGCRERSSRAES